MNVFSYMIFHFSFYPFIQNRYSVKHCLYISVFMTLIDIYVAVFAKIVNYVQLLTIYAKNLHHRCFKGPKYASGLYNLRSDCQFFVINPIQDLGRGEVAKSHFLQVFAVQLLQTQELAPKFSDFQFYPFLSIQVMITFFIEVLEVLKFGHITTSTI